MKRVTPSAKKEQEPEKKTPQKININIYLTKYLAAQDKIEISPVKRDIDYTDSPLKAAIEKLLLGPSDTEDAKGLSSSIPGGVRLLSVTIKNRTACLDFNSQIETGVGISLLESRLYQIVYTATQFENVKQVQFLIEGKIRAKFGSENINIRKPYSRLSTKPVF